MRSSRRMRSAALLVSTLALSLATSEIARAQSRDGAAAQPPATAFWEALGDTTLNRLISEALDANPDLRVVGARARAARADHVSAALDLVPTVTAVSGYSRQRLSSAAVPGAGGRLPDQDLWDAGLQMTWELDVFGRGRRTLQGRNALLASANEDVGDVRVLLAADVAGAYFDLLGARERLEVATRNADNQRRSLEVTLERLEAGRGTGLDTERAQAQLSTTLAAIPAIEAELATARHRIAILLGRPPASVLPGIGDQATPPALPAVPDVASLEAVVRERPDIRSVERLLAARTAFVGAARAEYLPRVSIGGRAGYTASAFESLGDSGTPRYAIGPVISWPLLDLGRVRNGVDAARAAEAEAAARYEHAILRALEEVESSLVSYAKAGERLQHLEEAAAASERATELARLRFEEGATGFLEVLDAERTQLDAQDRLAIGRTEAATGLVAVYRALGGRWAVAREEP